MVDWSTGGPVSRPRGPCHTSRWRVTDAPTLGRPRLGHRDRGPGAKDRRPPDGVCGADRSPRRVLLCRGDRRRLVSPPTTRRPGPSRLARARPVLALQGPRRSPPLRDARAPRLHPSRRAGDVPPLPDPPRRPPGPQVARRRDGRGAAGSRRRGRRWDGLGALTRAGEAFGRVGALGAGVHARAFTYSWATASSMPGSCGKGRWRPPSTAWAT